MACPRCGDICHCYAGVRTPPGTPLRPRFEVDSEDSPPAMLVDPEQYDDTEEQFSASLESPAAPAARFIPDALEQRQNSISAASDVSAEPNTSIEHESSGEQASSCSAVSTDEALPTSDVAGAAGNGYSSRAAEPAQAHSSSSPDAWKEELAARLSSYRAKRKPRPPKYPSLSLDFEPAFPPTSGSSARTADLRSSLAIENREQKTFSDVPAQKVRVVPADDMVPSSVPTPASARVIEFPRFFGPEEPSPDQLAEPVCEQPRILEAPEGELPAPALGGIVLEANDDPETEERPGFEVPLRSASISRRVFAAAIDGAVVMSAGVMFAYIFRQFVKVLPPVAHLLASATLVLGVVWAGYQYLLLTYSGTTPGLRLAKLQLTHFDGSAVLRSKRKWRAVASLLSGVSLGLGFAWCFLDEDALCWHDRITRTHLVPRD